MNERITRRDFLKWMALTAGSIAVGCNPSASASKDNPTSSSFPTKNPEADPNFSSTPTAQSTTTEATTKPNGQPEDEPEEIKRKERSRKKEKTLLEVLMASPIEEANKRRRQRQENDPEWQERVNLKLLPFYNFALFGYGETNEPGPRGFTPQGVIIGTYTVLSYDSSTGKLFKLSISHDFFSPEIAEAKARPRGEVNITNRISEAFNTGEKTGIGGFNLMRKVLENIFGLSIDFQTAFSGDKLISAFVDNVRQGIEIEVPEDTTLYPFYMDGKLYPNGANNWTMTKGKHKIDGKTVVGFIKAVPVPRFLNDYQKEKEHHVREDMVMNGLKRDFFPQLLTDPWTNLRLFKFLNEVSGKKDILAYDFDWKKVIMGNLNVALAELAQVAWQGNPSKLTIPDFSYSLYFADDRSANLPESLGAVRYDDNMYLPPGSSFSGDVRKNYWQPIRNLTEKVLLEF